MPFLPAESSLPVPSSFLIFRSVSLGLLTNLALLQLIFASWNVSASLSMGLSAPSTSVFIIFESCVLFFSVAFVFADFVWSRGGKLSIMLECSWIGIMSLFQIGIAISTTVNGSDVVCHTSLEWNVCASSSLLVPSTWLSSMLFLAYFLTLFMTTMTHRHLYSGIWRRSVYGIVWFGQPHEISSKTGHLNLDPHIDHYEDVEISSTRKQRDDPSEDVAPWAANHARRGIDPPFSRRPKSTSSNYASPPVSASLPSYPNKSAITDTGSRFIEKFRESSILARSQSSEHFIANYQVRQEPFPSSVVDIDSPIPLPRLSEWVRADVLKGLSVHTNPHTP